VKQKSSTRIYLEIPLQLVALVLLAHPSANIFADDLLGLYVGGAVGQAHLETSVSQVFADVTSATQTEDIDKSHAAFKVMMGIRPISLLGAEIEYMDFGESSGNLFGNPANISMKGAAAFGVLYLPVPLVDVFLKAGLARLAGTANGSICSPCACDICRDYFQLDRTNTSGAGGIGIQYRFGSWAVRGEYERFNAAGGNPNVLSAGVTWTFF
jgi:opacity protein-like surface antigen